jgi:hypothetical protein
MTPEEAYRAGYQAGRLSMPEIVGEYGRCRESLMADAYDMLKEQEPVVPELEQGADGIYLICKKCKTRLWKIFGVEFDINIINLEAMPKFCPQCGQAVKWE